MRYKKNLFVCFIGTDGSGKSTLAAISKNILLEHGHKAKIVWGAYDLIIMKPFVKIAKLLFLKQPNQYLDYTSYTKSIQTASKSSILMQIYLFSILVEYLFEIIFKITLPLIFGQTVIADRYIYDTATNICSNLKKNLNYHVRLISLLKNVCPKPDILFWVNVPIEMSIKRKNDIPSIDYLIYRKRYYENIYSHYCPIALDGSISLNVLEKNIRRIIRLHVPAC